MSMSHIVARCDFSALGGHELICYVGPLCVRLGWGTAMRKFFGIACSMILTFDSR